MPIALYLGGLAVGAVLGTYFKVPALAAATLMAVGVSGAALLFGQSLATTASIAFPAIVCMQVGYVAAAVLKGFGKS